MEHIRDFDLRYDVLEELGKGTFGKVYKIRERNTNKYLAAKVFDSSKEYIKGIPPLQFLRELAVYTELNPDHRANKYLCKCHGYTTDTYRLIIDYYDTDLTKKKFDYADLIKVYKSLLQSLDVLHSHGMAHRDIKPGNILYSNSENKAVLADLGSVRIMNMLPFENGATEEITTYQFIPPEFLIPKDDPKWAWKYSHAMDVWSLGVSFVHLTGIEWVLGPSTYEELSYDILNYIYGGVLGENLPNLIYAIREQLLTLNQENSDVRKLLEITESIIRNPNQEHPFFKDLYKQKNLEEGEKLRLQQLLLKDLVVDLQNKDKNFESSYSSDKMRGMLLNMLQTRYTLEQSNNILDIIMPMLQWKPKDRTNVKELLGFPIFNDGSKVEMIEETLISHHDLKPFDEQANIKINFRSYIPYISEIRNRQLRKSRQYVYQDVLNLQTSINYNHYTILIEWLASTSRSLALNYDSFHIGLNILDDFLSRTEVSMNKLQLIGASCQYLASYYNEVVILPVSDYVDVSGGAYTENELVGCVKHIIDTIDPKVFVINYWDQMLRGLKEERDYTTNQLDTLRYLSIVVLSNLCQNIIGKSQYEIFKLLMTFIENGEVEDVKINEELNASLSPGYQKHRYVKSKMFYFDNVFIPTLKK